MFPGWSADGYPGWDASGPNKFSADGYYEMFPLAADPNWLATSPSRNYTVSYVPGEEIDMPQRTRGITWTYTP